MGAAASAAHILTPVATVRRVLNMNDGAGGYQQRRTAAEVSLDAYCLMDSIWATRRTFFGKPYWIP